MGANYFIGYGNVSIDCFMFVCQIEMLVHKPLKLECHVREHAFFHCIGI